MDTRDVALTVLTDIEVNQTFSNLALGKALRKNQFADKAERAFLTRLVEGVMEYKIRLDYVIDRFSRTKVKKCKPVIRCLLRMGCYQILFMDRVPDSAACNEAVKLAKKHGFAGLTGFVNGVLRAIARGKDTITYPDEKKEPETYLSIWYSVPQWLVEMLIADYGTDRAQTILQASFAERKTSIRLNRACMEKEKETPESYRQKLESAGIHVETGTYYKDAWRICGYDFIHKIPGYKKGYFTVQDESSMCAVAAAVIERGDFVMDLCAAPGGKTTAAGAYASAGRVLSMDIAEEKLERIEENVAREQLENIQIMQHDATEYMPDYEEKADVVIADLPCSGLGIMGRKNDIKYRVQKEQIEELTGLQHAILQNACRYVKPGGTLLYSTCTITPEENKQQTARFLQEHPSFILREERQFIQGIHDCDGFYYAVMKKEQGV